MLEESALQENSQPFERWIGKCREPFTANTLSKLRNGRILHLDIGTGDGSFAYRFAKRNPEAFVVGLDASAANFQVISARAARKPARGRVDNVAFVRANIHDLPGPFASACDAIYIMLPWAQLMRDLLSPSAMVLRNLEASSKPGTVITILLNLRAFREQVPKQLIGIPEPTLQYVDERLRSSYAEFGITITTLSLTFDPAIDNIVSEWGKRLAHSRPLPLLKIVCCVKP